MLASVGWYLTYDKWRHLACVSDIITFSRPGKRFGRPTVSYQVPTSRDTALPPKSLDPQHFSSPLMRRRHFLRHNFVAFFRGNAMCEHLNAPLHCPFMYALICLFCCLYCILRYQFREWKWVAYIYYLTACIARGQHHEFDSPARNTAGTV